MCIIGNAKLKKKKLRKQLTEESEKRYQVEYNREKWDIWLKGRLTSDLKCTIGDLVPGGVTSRKNDFVSVTDGACVA